MTQSDCLGWDPGVCIAVTPQALPGWRSHAEQQGHLAFLLASTPKAPPGQAWCWFVVFQSLSYVQLFATPWTITHQAPLSMGFCRQAYWSGLPFLSRLVWRRLNWTYGEGKRNNWILGRGSSMDRFPFPGAHCDLSMEIHIWE